MSRGKNKILIISAFAAIILALPAQVVFAPLAHADPGIVSIDIDWIVDPAATYEPSGTLVSNNLLVGLYAASIDYFGYNVTIPANTTLQVQFSQTQATWYNSSGTPGGWDSLSDGDHTSTGRIALSTLAWSGNAFYYRIWLQNIDSASTPTVLGANVDYTAGSAPAPTYEPAGTLVSNNLLSGLTVNAINSFSYTISIPSGAGATAQFSQDNSTWCNSSNNCDGAHSDTLSDGTNTILLSGTGKLNWSGANFYYKISFTSSGANTPSLSSATVNYATTCTWVGTTGDVTQASNWSGCGGGVPGSGDTALFDDTGTTTTLTGNFTAGALISVTTTSKSYSIGGIISGTSTVTMSGTTTLTLSGANTFTGGLTIKKGIVSLTTSTSAGGGSGTGAITLGDTSGSANATLQGDGRTFANPIVLNTGTTG
ncbi:MAG: hypothetical protein NT026_00385, partial [Candidatus Staskawiczbacteria bacterium]|nr:hypothetical protein [Candidatus Staskawiczbacteria bacterium]